MRVAIVGAGTMGRAWADALKLAGLAKITAIVDPLVGTDHAPPWVAAYAEAILSTTIDRIDVGAIDAVVITAQTPVHADLIEVSLRCGYHVVVEKPLAPTIAEAERVVDLADALGLCLMVSQNYRQFPGVATLMDLVNGGDLGKVRSVSGRFWCDWKGKPYQHAMEHVMALEMAVHHFDLVRAIFTAEAHDGRVAEWNPVTGPYRSGAGLDAVFTMRRCDGSFPFIYSGSLVGHAPRTPWGGVWRIEFDRGTVLVDEAPVSHVAAVDHGYGVYLCHPDGAQIEWLGPFAADTMMLDASFRDFATSVRDSATPWSSGRDNLGTMRMAVGFMSAPVAVSEAPGSTS